MYVYRNICMIALRGTNLKMATSYHDIGSRVKHRRTGIDNQTSDYDFIVWTYLAFDEVACEFTNPELCPKV